MAGELDRFDRGPGRRVRRESREGEASVAEDPDEQVVEVVGDAAGEDAEGLEALAAFKFGF